MRNKKEYPLTDLRSLASRWGVIDDSKPLKYTQLELLYLIDARLRAQEGLLEKARGIYREHVSTIKRLSSPELWRFGNFKEAPPDYKEEYFRRMAEKNRE